MYWKEYFEPIILQRGFDYYIEDVVYNLDVATDIVRANVEGTQDYEVEIDFDEDGEIETMYCSCPYAEDGAHCKHMAAVLFHMEQEHVAFSCMQSDTEADKSVIFCDLDAEDGCQQKKDVIEKMVQDASGEDVRSFLSTILMEDDKALLRFRSRQQVDDEKENVEQYKYQVDLIVERYLGKNRFISYYEASDFIDELQDIYRTDIRQMIDQQRYMEAFELLNYIFVMLGEVDMDDSDGGTGMLADDTYVFWGELLEMASQDETAQMFEWFIHHLDGSVIDYLEEYIERILVEEFEDEPYLKQKIELADHMIQNSREQEDVWSKDYHIGKWTIYRLQWMKQVGCDEKEIKKYCLENWELNQVRKFYIDQCIEEEDYETALLALEDSCMIDKEFRGLILEYEITMKDLYQKMGDRERYIEKLWELVTEKKAGDLDMFLELKEQYSEDEWEEQREKIFQSLPKYARVDILYQEEKMYDRLMDYVMEEGGMYTLQEYESVLKKIYPAKVLEKYQIEVEKMAATSGARKKYKELVRILRKMKKLPEGKMVVNKIAKKWEQLYRNRPAMMNELEKL